MRHTIKDTEGNKLILELELLTGGPEPPPGTTRAVVVTDIYLEKIASKPDPNHDSEQGSENLPSG